MARLNRWDREWQNLVCALTAWEAVRSSQEYRRDWQENRHLAQWFKELPGERKTDQVLFGDPKKDSIEGSVWRWLCKLGRKWWFANVDTL